MQALERCHFDFFRRPLTGLLVATTLVLVACGGGGGGGDGVATIPLAPEPPASSALDRAMSSGDASALNDPQRLAQQAQYVQQQIQLQQNARYASLYQGVSTEYTPSNWTYWVQPVNPATAQPYIVGDKGNALASISVANGGRSAAYGADVLYKFYANDLVAHRPAFKRLLAWLAKGDANAALPATLNVAYAGYNAGTGKAGMTKAGVPTNTITCDFMANAACAANADLLVVGGELAASAGLEAGIRGLVAAGRPVLYVHTKANWTSDSASQLLAGMGMKFGPYGGNYWADDKVAPGRSAAANQRLGDPYVALAPLLQQMASNTFGMYFDWTLCTGNNCSDVRNLQDAVLGPLDRVREQIDAYNGAGQNLFTTPQTDLLRSLVLWADVVRRQMKYPLDKVANPADFQKALIADALVAYVRPTAPAQADLGSFAGPITAAMQVSATPEVVNVTVPSAQGFTAIGRLAAPGKTLTVELVSGGSATLALRLNTQRTGSTRLWEKNRYNRPRFLRSPDMPLQQGKPLQVSTPYGGTLQLVFDKATPMQNVQLRVSGVAKHPFLDMSRDAGDQAGFVAALNVNPPAFDWAEIKLPGIEVHSRLDKMRSVINGKIYEGNIAKFLDELKVLFFEDAYLLAGFNLTGKQLTAHVRDFCVTEGWDCTDATMHRMPGTQHINVDNYSQCGNGCSGNPYDQDWGLNPRGWGESHEVGHNLQKGLLQVYDGRSTEVSNNLFPAHKNWRMFEEMAYNEGKGWTGYVSAFNMIKAARAEADPVEGAYQRIWSDATYAAEGNERLAFYLQWVHYWAQRHADMATGWDIVTLLYLQQRQLEALDDKTWAANKNKLGYSTFEKRINPWGGADSVSGNDNLLMVLSWITKRDQRATFDLWGVRYSAKAAAQVQAYGFAAERALFFGTDRVNNHRTVQQIDMQVANPVWPF